jgi:hypothetical protein
MFSMTLLQGVGDVARVAGVIEDARAGGSAGGLQRLPPFNLSVCAANSERAGTAETCKAPHRLRLECAATVGIRKFAAKAECAALSVENIFGEETDTLVSVEV